jgi:membrane peptidoglycan carboxypeptidase
MGVRFTGGRDGFLQSGLAGAIGTVEVRPVDLTSAFGTLANGGVRHEPRMILEIRDAAGDVVWSAGNPEGEQVISPQSAYLVTDILAGNTDPRHNPIWAEKLQLRNGPDGQRRPAAVKTGTANDARDLATYGYLAPPEDAAAPALAVGIWMGNSDHSNPKTKQPATSLTAAAPLWQAFVRQLTNEQPVAGFARPVGITEAPIDAFSGGLPGSWTRDTRTELFADGTQPRREGGIDQAGLLYSRACGGWRVDPLKAELGPESWDADVKDWMDRARRGPGVVGEHDSTTAYFWGRSSWGGPILGPCPKPKPKATPPPRPAPTPRPGPPGGGGNPNPPGGGDERPAPPGGGNDGGNGNGGDAGGAVEPGPTPAPDGGTVLRMLV